MVSIGNLWVGGTGKTPFVIALGEMLKARGIWDVYSRGYGGVKLAVSWWSSLMATRVISATNPCSLPSGSMSCDCPAKAGSKQESSRNAHSHRDSIYWTTDFSIVHWHATSILFS